MSDTNNTVKYRLIRNNRKSVSISITPDCEVIVKAPVYARREDIEHFIIKKQDWILASLEKQKLKKDTKENAPKFTYDELKKYAGETSKRIEPLLKQYSETYGVRYNRVTIRNQKTRWGSCSGKKNLNFNCLLALVPDRVVKYVVVHELCHLLEMNHSRAFWSLVAREIPDYKQDVKWLKENGGSLILRLP